MPHNDPNRKSTGLVTLALAGSALVLFAGYRSCDRRRPADAYTGTGTTPGSTTRPHSSHHRPGFFYVPGSRTYTSPASPGSSSHTSRSFSTSRGGFGSHGTSAS